VRHNKETTPGSYTPGALIPAEFNATASQ